MSKNFIRKTKVGKITSAFVGITTAVWLSGAAAIMPIAAQADTVSDLQAQISALLAQITSLQSQLSALQGGTTGTVCGYTFGADLKQGSTGADAKNLQTVLNSDAATQVAASGVGSSGNETTYFGSLTKAAVVKFQDKYASEVLTPIGLTAGTGYVGSMTRAKLNALFGTCVTTKAACEDGIDNDADGLIDYPADTDCTSASDTSESTTAVGTGISVSSPTQPTASIAVQSAARMPFTKVTLTAGTDGDVVVNGIQVERTGLANDTVFSGVVLLDEDGSQLGIAKTFNSDHKATVGEAFTVKAGQSRTMTIAGNMAADNSTRAGQVAFLSVTGISTSATVTGALPITGAGHTINATLSIGTATPSRGPLDPNTSASKEVGTIGYTFSSVKVTAGSAEKIRVKSIRWNQAGSAAMSDLENVKTYVDGVAYDTTVSSDGKYYTSTFGTGIVVDKGMAMEMTLKGDIVGGSARTVIFDIYKTTDLYVTGETYGYGITPSGETTATASDSSAQFTTGTPWYDSAVVTISAGTMNVQKCTSGANCEAQNIAVNLANQPLGGFIVEVKGEPISVAQTIISIASTTGSGTGVLTSVSLYDENGAVLAGPVDGVYSSALVQTVTFTDTVTFPIGKKTYVLKGKVASTIGNNGTYTASFTPSTAMTTVTGQTTGTTVVPSPTSAITMNAMTVKTGALAISVSSVPLAQTVIAGASQFLFANYQLDAGSSGEDVSLSAFPVEYNAGSNATKLTSCALYDGTTALTTGSNIKNPTAAASSTSFTFDTPFVIPKGTTKTVALKCDIAGDATAGNVYSWGYDTTCDPSPIGKTSGQAITETETDSAGQSMTVAAGGGYSVADDSTPGYTIVSAGTTGITLLKLKFSATTEDVDIARVNFELGSVASNTPMDLVGQKVTLYDAASPTTSIGEATFSTSDYATSTLIAVGSFRVPSGGSKTMLVKGDISAISGTVGPLIASGDLLIVKYDGGSNGSANGNYGKGVSSGSNITPSSADITPTGVRIMKSYPTFAKVDLSSTERLLQTKSDATLYKFKVTASDGDVYLNKFSFIVSSSSVSATTSNFAVYAYTDSAYSVADTTFTTDGLINYNKYHNGYGINSVDRKTGCNVCQIGIYANKTATVATTTYKVPSGQSRWFELRADVASVESITGTEYITVRLEGDTTWPVSIPNLMGAATSSSLTSIDGDAQNDLIWSPNSTSTSIGLGDLDFTNGYGVVGLPSTNMSVETLTSSN